VAIALGDISIVPRGVSFVVIPAFPFALMA
jgi:hypothetical protein